MTAMRLGVEDANFLFDFVRRRSSISLDESKLYLLATRLAPVLRDHELSDSHALVMALQRAGTGARALQQDVVEAMTTNETSFFRDERPFAFLRDEAIPELLRARRAQRRLRIWSAACSTGQELYSIAMLLDREFPETSGWDIELMGTDLDEKVLARASEGLYSSVEVRRGISDELRDLYFTGEGTRWRISERLRRRVRFWKLNMTDPWTSVGKVDMLFMRNVLIYFDRDVKCSLLQRAHDQLADDGFVFLGNAETTHDMEPRLVPARGNLSSCYQKSRG